MSLEEFKIIDAKTLPIGKLITMIARGHSIYLNHHLEDFGINATQLHLLFEISHQNDINQVKIAERCNINKGSVARSIKKLEDKKLITRQIDDANRRQNKVSLTQQGRDVLNESIELLDLWESKVFNDNIIEKEALQNALKEIVINTIELNKEDRNGKNKNIEMITGDPKKAIVKLALPMMLSMLLIMLYNIADSIWVAGLGADALAAVGFITPLFMVLVGLGNGIGAGANSLIARFIGAGKIDQANNAGLHGIVLAVIVSVIFTILIEVFMVPILQFMGAGETIQYAMDYSYIIFGFLFVFVYSGVASAIFRSEGDMRRATIAIAVTAVMNIILDPVFIYVLNLGIAGAAWATVFSAILSCLVMSYWIWGKKDTYLDLSFKNFNYQGSLMIDTLQVAIPSTLETIVFSALAIIINSMLVMASGTTAVAVYTASMRIVQLAMIPLIGLGTAVLTVSGVAYGAHNHKNLKTAHSYSIKLGFAISIVLGAVMFIFSSPIATMFSYTEASAALSPEIATAISVLSLFVLAIPHGMMSSMMFQGVGKGTYSLLITLLRSLILESVFAYVFCFIFGWGLSGIYGGVVFGCFVGGTVGYIWAKFFIRKFTQISIKKYTSHEN